MLRREFLRRSASDHSLRRIRRQYNAKANYKRLMHSMHIAVPEEEEEEEVLYPKKEHHAGVSFTRDTIGGA